MVDHPLELLIRSQQVAVRLATDTLRTMTNAAVTGVTQPDELVRQVGDLAGAVAGMAGAITGLAGATAQPLQDFIVRQRAEAVTALEKVTAPVFAIVGTEPTQPRRSAARAKKPSPAKPAKTAQTRRTTAAPTPPRKNS